VLSHEFEYISYFFLRPKSSLQDVGVRELDPNLSPGMMGLLTDFVQLYGSLIPEL
jgi:hypothetical protein